MPSISQLEYILAIDEFRNFSKAAEHCQVAQPSLSIQVGKLEEELGFIVFDRSKKPLLPTDDGIKILAQARIILSEYKKLFSAARNSDELSGEFKLAIIPTLAPYLLPLFLPLFSKAYPHVKLILEEMKTKDIIRALEADRIDAGLLVTPLKEDSIIERVLFYEDFFVYASETHPYAAKSKIKSADLSADGLWLLEEGHCFREQVAHVCSLKKSPSTFSNVTFQSGNLETLIKIINRGDGFTLLPQMCVDQLSKKDKDLHLRSIHQPIPSREVSLVSSRLFYKEKYLDALEKIILNEIPDSLRSPKKKNIIPLG
jgi:LysR family transcriptional regulator, hydrogen peroxide-inducible genes activator